jgi:hypothetical protein
LWKNRPQAGAAGEHRLPHLCTCEDAWFVVVAQAVPPAQPNSFTASDGQGSHGYFSSMVTTRSAGT